MERTLDIIASLEEKQKPKRKNIPWVISQLLKQRKIVRNRERPYIKYTENHDWRAFTRECNRYNRMLDYNKTHYLVTKINEANKDSKKLFRALYSILGNKNENPLPTGTTNSQLAEDFADFFLNNIREGFTNIPVYQLRQLDMPKLRNFTPVTQRPLAKIIKAMPAKTCQLVLEGCLLALTLITNRLLHRNLLCKEWKEVLVKPLKKNHQLA